MDLEKAFDRVPREVVWWALRCLGVDEWTVSVIKAMYEDATTTVRFNGRESKALVSEWECIRAQSSVHCCVIICIRGLL